MQIEFDTQYQLVCFPSGLRIPEEIWAYNKPRIVALVRDYLETYEQVDPQSVAYNGKKLSWKDATELANTLVGKDLVSLKRAMRKARSALETRQFNLVCEEWRWAAILALVTGVEHPPMKDVQAVKTHIIQAYREGKL